MKKILITLAAIGLATSAFAQSATVGFTTADSDASGDVTLAEAQAVWPDLTQEQFEAADGNKDGSLDQPEYDAYAAGLPAPSDTMAPSADTTEPATTSP